MAVALFFEAIQELFVAWDHFLLVGIGQELVHIHNALKMINKTIFNMLLKIISVSYCYGLKNIQEVTKSSRSIYY